MSSLTSEQEIQFLLDLKSGDDLAFRKIFDAYYKYLILIAYRYLNDGAKAKDITHDTFVEIWNRRESLKIESGLKAYLRKTTVNKCLNYIKREKRIDFSEPSQLPETPVEAIAQQEIEARDTKEIIQTAVDGLPLKCRVIFSMSRFEEMTHKEIAAKLEISTKTIENQITRALRVIRSAISEHSLFLIFWSNLFFYV